MFLLDTNVISELRKAGDRRADASVVSWISATQEATLFLSVITLMEVELGVLRVERRDPRQGHILRKWVQQDLLPQFNRRILPVTTDIAIRCAALHVPNPRPRHDALIAATALVHNMTVVTRDIADFEPTGVQLINPWEVVP
jgi:predicted nucleic acid-binding protein